MEIFQNKKELQKRLTKLRNEGNNIGLVPTMGALHQGHLSLMQQAITDNQAVVVSIFVNPTQFNNSEDLEKYPSSLESDIELIASLSNDIIIFVPTKEHIYEGEVVSKRFDFEGLEGVMEGAFRTGHFNGVATIVELLFNAVKPNRAYFGEKDFQQLQIIKKLVKIKGLPIKIVPCPIERESHGLALSSRNERLSQTTRKAASFIYNTLTTVKTKFGTKNAQVIRDWVTTQYDENQLFELEYFEMADVDTLTPTNTFNENTKYRAFIAVYTEGIRLIDNIALN